MKNWSISDQKKANKAFDSICSKLTELLQKKQLPEAPEVQAVIAQHYDWLKQFWTPDKESYIGLGQSYTEAEWQDTFTPYHPELASFIAQAIQEFANKNL
jgi:hypothetical protein